MFQKPGCINDKSVLEAMEVLIAGMISGSMSRAQVVKLSLNPTAAYVRIEFESKHEGSKCKAEVAQHIRIINGDMNTCDPEGWRKCRPATV